MFYLMRVIALLSVKDLGASAIARNLQLSTASQTSTPSKAY